MGRLLLGLLKGVLAGGVVGGAAHGLALSGGWGYPVAIVTGFVVGLLAGRPVWSHAMDPAGTIITPILKAIVGAGVGALAFFVFGKVDLPMVHLGQLTASLRDLPILWAPAVGAIYGAWVEVDDAPTAGAKPVARAAVKPGKPAGKK